MLRITTSVVGTKYRNRLHDNGLLGQSKIDNLYLDVGRIVVNFHFSIVPLETLGLISPVREWQIPFEGDWRDSTV